MKNNKSVNSQIFSLSVLAAFSMVLLCLPAFSMTGLLAEPIIFSFLGGMAISFLLSILKSPDASGLAQIFFIIFWIFAALLKEIELQLDCGFVSYWIEFFYFDKLLVIGSVWLGAAVFFPLKRIISSDNIELNCFFKLSSIAFAIFYFSLLFYSFVLIRLRSAEYPFRFIPFLTIKNYIKHFEIDPYETLMNFLGNLFYFTPMGYILYIFLRKKQKPVRIIVVFLFPLIAYTLLEFSQYIFQNGFCEFDDMAMNSIGFWFGSLLCLLTDCFAKKLSKNRIIYFWDISS